MKHEAHWMASEVNRVSQKQVADGAHLDADIFLLNLLLKCGVQEQLEAMA